MDNHNKKYENDLTEISMQKDEADRRLLLAEVLFVSVITVFFLIVVFVACFVQMADWLRIGLISSGLVLFIVGAAYGLRIEQVAGYYECDNCHYRYVPKFKTVLWAAHIGRTRYMRCPECNCKSWNKKVIGKK